METQILPATQAAITKAATLINNHEIVAFPTETVYGLGASIFDTIAIQKIYAAKGRPSDNPLIAHIADIAQASLIGQNIPATFYLLAKTFFPGPLTLVVTKQDSVPDLATAGLPTIGIRKPNHPIALKLIKSAKTPLVAPSANLSGKPSPTKAIHVYQDLQGKIPLILDAGSCQIGIESTVLDLTQEPYAILRPGHITQKEIETVLGQPIQSSILTDESLIPKSPGMKYAHYQPLAKIHVLYFKEEIKAILPEKKLGNTILMSNIDVDATFAFGRKELLTEQNLYRVFREADEENNTDIFILIDEKTKTKAGLMNRIYKAQGK
jgi:L-threonylcarbamoyladenylate synthase